MNKLGKLLVVLGLVAIGAGLALPATATSPEGTILKVVVDLANVRFDSNLVSQVVGQVGRGTLLESSLTAGEWYSVTLPPDKNGSIVTGYIHKSMVEVVMVVGKTPKVKTPEPPSAPRVRTTPPARPEREGETTPPPQSQFREHYGRALLISGPFLKFGWMTSPKAGGFGNAWLASFGFDKGLGKNIGLGFEIQPAIRNYSEIDLKMIPVMGFVNLKAGLNLGDLLPVLKSLNILGGFGLGAEAVFQSIGLEGGETATKFKANFAFHLLGGLEFDLGSLRLIAEYQMAKVSVSSVDNSAFRYFLLFGLRF